MEVVESDQTVRTRKKNVPQTDQAVAQRWYMLVAHPRPSQPVVERRGVMCEGKLCRQHALERGTCHSKGPSSPGRPNKTPSGCKMFSWTVASL